MKGTMLIISPSGGIKTVPLTKPPEAETLHSEVGGWIEAIPHFSTIDYHGTIHQCVAFGNEEAKLKQMLRNQPATKIWYASLKRSGFNEPADYLAGKIIIIFGDRSLMKAL